jgi:hypothetical protein
MKDLTESASQRKTNHHHDRRECRFTPGEIAELYRLERDRLPPRGLTARDRLTVARRYFPEWRR